MRSHVIQNAGSAKVTVLDKDGSSVTLKASISGAGDYFCDESSN